MVYKRHLFMIGSFNQDFDKPFKTSLKETFRIGDKEKRERVVPEAPTSRTWWRKWLKIK